MIAIKPFAEVLDVGNEINVLKKIELVGRTCYKSTGKIKEGSAEKFVAGLIKRGHEAMLEHASFCFEIDFGVFYWTKEIIRMLSTEHGFHSFMYFTIEDRILMSGNVRAWRDLFKNMMEWVGIPICFEGFIKENPVLFPEYQDESFNPITLGSIRQISVNDLKTEQEFLTHCDVTVRFVVDRGISHELVRHRVASFAQESTRYCNYSKDDFGTQITYIIPRYLSYQSPAWDVWKKTTEDCESAYFKLLDIGLMPEEARAVLPTSLKTELIMTANCAEWKHFFKLRACNSTGKAHPQMLEVSRPLLDEFKHTIGVVFDDLTYGE